MQSPSIPSDHPFSLLSTDPISEDALLIRVENVLLSKSHANEELFKPYERQDSEGVDLLRVALFPRPYSIEENTGKSLQLSFRIWISGVSAHLCVLDIDNNPVEKAILVEHSKKDYIRQTFLELQPEPNSAFVSSKFGIAATTHEYYGLCIRDITEGNHFRLGLVVSLPSNSSWRGGQRTFALAPFWCTKNLTLSRLSSFNAFAELTSREVRSQVDNECPFTTPTRRRLRRRTNDNNNASRRGRRTICVDYTGYCNKFENILVTTFNMQPAA